MGDLTLFQTHEHLLFVYENEGLRCAKLVNVDGFVADSVQNLQGLVSVLDQELLVELLQEFDFIETALITNIHNWLARICINDSHGEGAAYLLEQQQDDAIADLKLN